MNRLKEIKENIEYLDELRTEAVIAAEDLSWLIDQAELLWRIKYDTGILIGRKLSNEELEKFKNEWCQIK
jgi:hypothetical protein